MSRFFHTLITVALACLVIACAPLQPEREYVQRDDLKVDPEVRHSLSVTELLQSRLEQPGGGSLLQIQFSVEAFEDTDMEWAVTWFDEAGMVVPGVGEGYREVRILRNQVRFFMATAPHERVVSFQLHLREDR
ncbi:MAG: hypothetical protein R3175_08555 [Marinobacter sp.]|uniref:DUF1425 domain-containing protein n=1 Tax=Marinobacter sp. TaxID=50741 RepID=UPI00299D11D8|nr:hypothetical protein [Marinobacter sp.]MDX1756093.1 hypothetical protein [Marinobacter sp.]